MDSAVRESIDKQKESNDLIRVYFKKCKDDIKVKNLYMLRRACMYIAIFYIVVLTLTVVLVPDYRLMPTDFFVVPLIIIYYFINIYTRKNEANISYRKAQVICLVFYGLLLVDFTMLDVFLLPDKEVFWSLILFMIFPVLYIDRVYKYGIYGLLAVLYYMAFSYKMKPEEVMARDAHAVIVTYVIAMLVAHILLEIRAHEGIAMLELRKISAFDKLTHVLNKDALEEKIESYLVQNPESNCALCFFDLDNFKGVNDSLGHNAGDLLLERVGLLLRDNFRSYDIIGRYGGDEFVVLMPNMRDEIILKMRCRTMQMFLADFAIGNGEPFTVSIGAVISKGKLNKENLFRMADDALYESKLSGKNTCTIWTMEAPISTIRPIMLLLTSNENDYSRTLYLEEGSRYEILTATNSSDALRLASQYAKKLQIVIDEIDADEKSNYMLLNYMKNRERFSNIPILAVASTLEQSVYARDNGANEVLMMDSHDDLFKETLNQLLIKK